MQIFTLSAKPAKEMHTPAPGRLFRRAFSELRPPAEQPLPLYSPGGPEVPGPAKADAGSQTDPEPEVVLPDCPAAPTLSERGGPSLEAAAEVRAACCLSL